MAVAKVRLMAKRPEQNNITLRPAADTQLEQLQREKERSRKVRNANMAVAVAAVLLFLLYVFSVVLYVVPASTQRSLAVILSMQQDKFRNFLNFLSGGGGYGYITTIVRYSVILLSGAALAAAGCVFQGSFKNIIASPTTMGVQAGASLGNALYTLLCVNVVADVIVTQNTAEDLQSFSVLEMNKQQLFAVAGSLLAIGIVSGIASALGKGNYSGANILFAGIVFSSFVGAIVTCIEYYFMYFDPVDTRWRTLRVFGMGNFDRVMTSDQLLMMSVTLVPCLMVLLLISPKLNVLVMGEDEAATMGVNVRLYRTVLIVIGTLMAAVVYAFCGAIGFVGFIAPQICRRFTGPDFRKLIPMCMCVGGILLLLVYNIALWFGYNEYINLFVSVLGCVMMIFALATGKGGRSYG